MGDEMKRAKIWMLLFAFSVAPLAIHAQVPVGPIAPQPGVAIQKAPPSLPKLKAQVTLVNTPVTVRNGKGEMVHDLEARDFRVTDNGAPQAITHFDLGGDPMSLVILVETSSRIAPMLPELRKTGILLTQTVMGPSGEAAIVGFNDSVDKLLDFRGSADEVEKTIAGLAEGTSGAKLYDGMAVAVEMLTSRPQATAQQPGRRRVLLIISEATDYGSAAKLGDVLRRAQLANVTIYSVGLSTTRAEFQEKPREHGPTPITPPGTFGRPPLPGTVQTPTTEAQRDANIDLLALAVWAVQNVENQVRDHALEVAATATGGAHLPTFKDRSIEKAIDEIGGELHSQYTLSYTPAGSNESGYHEIKVEVDRKGLKVRARPGYYVASPES
jgi:VWFA-related protein